LTLRPFIAFAALMLAAGCGRSGSEAKRDAAMSGSGSRVGIDPVRTVQLLENHAGALIVWRRAAVRDRVLVHLDGHADLDWLPDVTIARFAAADADELSAMEQHPYATDGETLRRFGSRNFIYPAARLGLVRELVWVVPDGTLHAPQASEELVRRLILGKMQMIPLDEARGIHDDGRSIRGTVLGLEVTICELDDLPAFDEPVLLDVDLDYLTTRSVISEEVDARPSSTPQALVDRLRGRGIRTDLATIAFSTVGGFVPPQCRWLGPALTSALARGPDAELDRWKRRAEADEAAAGGRESAAVAAWRKLAAENPDDGSLWYALALAEARFGRAAAERDARARAVAADPILEDASLFEADALWLNQSYADALVRYREYLRLRPSGPFVAYALYREAGCLTRTGRVDDAIATLRKVIGIAPGHGDSHADLGLLLREEGQLDAAIDQLLEARKILPDVGAYAMALGTTYARQERFDEALVALEGAVARRPTWVPARVNLGLVLERVGRQVDAARQLNAAAVLEPGDARVARLLMRLKRQGFVTTEVAARP
jgi:tetratricopeptide (TPR) repeat protein